MLWNTAGRARVMPDDWRTTPERNMSAISVRVPVCRRGFLPQSEVFVRLEEVPPGESLCGCLYRYLDKTKISPTTRSRTAETAIAEQL